MLKKIVPLALLVPSALSALELTYNGENCEQYKPGVSEEKPYYHLTELAGKFDGLPEKGDMISLSSGINFYYDGSKTLAIKEHRADPLPTPVVYRIIDGEKVPFAVRIVNESDLNFRGRKAVLNPLKDLTKEEREGLAAIEIQDWDGDKESELKSMDLSKCCVEIDAVNSKAKALPLLNGSLRQLIVAGLPYKAKNNFTRELEDLVYFECNSPDFRATDLIRRNRGLIRLFAADFNTIALDHKELRSIGGRHEVSGGLDCLQRLPKLESADFSSSFVKNLPAVSLQNLKELKVINSNIKFKEVKAFEKKNPQCEVTFGYQRTLSRALKGATRLDLHEYREKRRKQFYSTEDAKEIAEFIDCLQVKTVDKYGHNCFRDGKVLEFHIKGKPPVKLMVQWSGVNWLNGPWFQARLQTIKQAEVLKKLIDSKWDNYIDSKFNVNLDEYVEKELGIIPARQFTQSTDSKQALKLLTGDPIAHNDNKRIAAVTKLFVGMRESNRLSPQAQNALYEYIRRADLVKVAEAVDFDVASEKTLEILCKFAYKKTAHEIVTWGTESSAFRKLLALGFYFTYHSGMASKWAKYREEYFKFVDAYVKDHEIIPLLDKIKPKRWREKVDKNEWFMFRGDTPNLRRDLVHYLIYLHKQEESKQVKVLIGKLPKELQTDLNKYFSVRTERLNFEKHYKNKAVSDIGRVNFGMETFNRNGLWGLRDLDGKTVVPCKYQEIKFVSKSSFMGKLHNEFTLMDLKEKPLSQPFDDRLGGYHISALVMVRGDKYFVIEGEKTIPLPHIPGYIYDEPISTNCFIVKSGDDKVGVTDRKGNWIFKPRRGYLRAVRKKFFLFSENMKASLYTLTGKHILDCKSNAIYGMFSEEGKNIPSGWTKLKVDGFPPMLAKGSGIVRKFKQQHDINPVEDGIITYSGKGVGVMDYDSKWLISPNYDYICACGNGIFKAHTEDGYKTISTKGKKAPKNLDLMNGNFKYGVTTYRGDNGLWGIINSAGEILMKPKLTEQPHIYGKNRMWIRSENSRGFYIFDFRGNVL